MMKTIKLISLAFLILGVSFASWATVSAHASLPAAAQDLSMSVQPAFDGYFKYGEWLTLWIELENYGPDLTATIEVPVVGGGGTVIYIAPVELPALSHKRLPVYVLPNNFTRELEVQLKSGEGAGQLLASQKAAVQPLPQINYLVGLVAPERGALALIDAVVIPGATRDKTLVDFSLAELTDKSESLRSFDLIIINDVDTSSLMLGQLAALETWVRQGGRLVIGGGAGAQRTLSGLTFLNSLQADSSGIPLLTLDGLVDQQSLEGLSQFANPARPVRVPGPFVAAQASTNSGYIFASQEDLPLVIEWPFEQGYLDFVALDLSASPFDAWNGTINFWEKLIGPSAIYPEWMPVDVSPRQQFASNMPYALTNLPMLDLPSAKGLALLLGLYILLVGPINYLVLRWQKRLHWAWLTIPAITLIFSAASFGLGYLLHGTDLFVNKIAVVRLEPSGRAQVTSFVGLFSPAREAYELQVRDGGLLSPLTPYYDPWASGAGTRMPTGRVMTLVQGNPAYVRGLSVEQWSMQSFMSEGIAMDFGPVSADLRLIGDTLVGEVYNNSHYVLQDAALVLGSRFTRLGDLSPGSRSEVNLDVSDFSAPNFGSPISYALFENEINSQKQQITSRQVEVRRSIIENLLERTPPYVSARPSGATEMNNLGQTPLLLAWLDEAPPEVRVSGSLPGQQATGVVILPITYSLPESGAVNIPPGLIAGRLVEPPRDGGSCGMNGSTAVYIANGEAVFEFTLAVTLKDVPIDYLKLAIWTDGSWFNAPGVALYDWTLGAWTTLEGINQGVNLIPNTMPFIADGYNGSPPGLVRVRLTEQNGQSCYYIGLGLEASR